MLKQKNLEKRDSLFLTLTTISKTIAPSFFLARTNRLFWQTNSLFWQTKDHILLTNRIIVECTIVRNFILRITISVSWRNKRARFVLAKEHALFRLASEIREHKHDDHDDHDDHHERSLSPSQTSVCKHQWQSRDGNSWWGMACFSWSNRRRNYWVFEEPYVLRE